MTVVSEQAVTAAGLPAAGVAIVTLAGEAGAQIVGYGPDGDVIAPAVIRFTGVWSAELTANTLIIPAGTAYQIVVHAAGVLKGARYITVPDVAGPVDVADILSVPPGGIPTDPAVTAIADLQARMAAVEAVVPIIATWNPGV